MQNPQAEYLIRHPSHDDIDRVYDFGNACDIADYGEPDTDLGDLSDLWNEADLEKDAWIAVTYQGQIIGYALISGGAGRKFLDLYAHNTLTPTPLTEELLQNCELRAAEWGNAGVDHSQDPVASSQPIEAVSGSTTSSNLASSITGFAGEVNRRLCLAFENQGFCVYTYHYRMQMDFDGMLPFPEFPSGYQLSAYQPSDEQELYNLIESTFDWPGRSPNPIERWRSMIFRNGRYDPELFTMLRRDGRLVGASLALDERPRGWIKQLAIAKDLQGHGIGSLLLRHTLSLFNAKGMDYVALGVSSSNQKAVEFYQRCGMHQTRLFLEYRKQLV